MGRRGPPPTPTPVLEKRGSWRAKTRKKEPKLPVKKPTCPKWLNKEAKVAWKKLVKQLMQMGVLSEIDTNALARYCQIWAMYMECIDFIKSHGTCHPVKDIRGKPVGFKEFPQVAHAMKFADQLLRLEQHFGLTPSARTRLESERNATPSPGSGQGPASSNTLSLSHFIKAGRSQANTGV